MPNFFGALLTATPGPELMEHITDETMDDHDNEQTDVESSVNNAEPSKIHHHHHHFYDDNKTNIDVNQWYVSHCVLYRKNLLDRSE